MDGQILNTPLIYMTITLTGFVYNLNNARTNSLERFELMFEQKFALCLSEWLETPVTL